MERDLSDRLARRNIPRRLEEDLAQVPKFKPVLRTANSRSANGNVERNLTVGDVMAHSVETAMYDEIFGSVVSRKPPVGMTPALDAALARNTAKKATGSTVVPSSSPDLTVGLLARLTDCETELKATRKQLAEKLRRITELEDENKELKALLVEPAEVYDELEFVKGQNADLLSKLNEMEEFLKDYGLKWVGTSSMDGHLSIRESSKDEDTKHVGASYDIFSKKIQELNDMISAEPAQVVTEEGGKITKLARPSEILEQIRVVFYSNGLMVRRGPFRECGSESYKQFTRDIMDGYFPAEFKDDYPDGVVFVLVDRHNIAYDSSVADKEDALTAQKLLQRLPKTVIRNGEIVDVRSSVQDRLGLDKASNGDAQAKNTLKSSASSAQEKSRDQILLQSVAFIHCEEQHRKPVTVQLRWIDGSLLVVKLDVSDDVGTIRSLVESYFASRVDSKADSKETAYPPQFELRTVWPARCVDDDCSLADAGLVPNGTLHAVRRRP